MATMPKERPPDRRGIDVAELADQWLGAKGGIQLQDAGPASKHLYEIIRSEVHTSPLIATTFWQAFIGSQLFPDLLRSIGASPLAVSREGSAEHYIVCHGRGWPRFDLVVFDPDFRGDSPAAVDVAATDEQLSLGWERFRDRKRLTNVNFRLFESIAIEASNAQPYGVIVAKRPELTFTRTPSPPWSVSPVGVSSEWPH